MQEWAALTVFLRALATFAPSNDGLLGGELDLSDSNVDDNGLQYLKMLFDDLATDLLAMPTKLGLRHNKITCEGMKSLGYIVERGCAELDLAHNRIGNRGVGLLVRSMENMIGMENRMPRRARGLRCGIRCQGRGGFP